MSNSEKTISTNRVMPRTLVLNPQSMELAADLMGNTSIELISGNPLRPLHKFHYAFDHVFSYHVLNLAYNENAASVLKAWDRCLKPGGLLHVFVPNFPWALESFSVDDPPQHLVQHILGWNREEPTKSLYWPRLLRADYQRAGIPVVHAQIQYYEIKIEENQYRAEQIYVQSRRPHPDDIKEANHGETATKED